MDHLFTSFFEEVHLMHLDGKSDSLLNGVIVRIYLGCYMAVC